MIMKRAKLENRFGPGAVAIAGRNDVRIVRRANDLSGEYIEVVGELKELYYLRDLVEKGADDQLAAVLLQQHQEANR